jgi:hypothetical protein
MKKASPITTSQTQQTRNVKNVSVNTSKLRDNINSVPHQKLLDIQNAGGRHSINSMVSTNSPIKLKSTFFFGSKGEQDTTSNYPY